MKGKITILSRSNFNVFEDAVRLTERERDTKIHVIGVRRNCQRVLHVPTSSPQIFKLFREMKPMVEAEGDLWSVLWWAVPRLNKPRESWFTSIVVGGNWDFQQCWMLSPLEINSSEVRAEFSPAKSTRVSEEGGCAYVHICRNSRAGIAGRFYYNKAPHFKSLRRIISFQTLNHQYLRFHFRSCYSPRNVETHEQLSQCGMCLRKSLVFWILG